MSGAQATVVDDVHAVLMHTSAVASDAVGVRSELAKPKPLIVTDPLEVRPMFGGLLALTHGAEHPHDAPCA